MREPCPAAFSFRTFNERAQITNGKVTDRTLWLICLGPIMEQAIAPIAKPGSAVVLRHAGHNISEQGDIAPALASAVVQLVCEPPVL
jgi:hypothetical protein